MSAATVPSTGIGHELDEIRALELIFAEDSLRCRGFNRGSCKNAAEYRIVCPCGGGSSEQCGACLGKLRDSYLACDSELAFFGSRGCGHTVKYTECTILPI